MGGGEDWMDWTGDVLNIGKYSGIYRQDERIPFVFWGGKKNTLNKYNGPYTFICPQGDSIPKNINLNRIYDSFYKMRFGSGSSNGGI